MTEEKDERIVVLLVDDEEALLQSTKRRLEVRAFRVIAVDSGEKALEVAREHRVDVAVLDLKMPGMSGKELLVELKREHSWLEVVVLTGHGSLDAADRVVCDRAYAFLVKPCPLESLLEVLAAACEKTVRNRYEVALKEMEGILKTPTLTSAHEVLGKWKELDAQRRKETK